MLKIIDDVDLKELEKFGYVYGIVSPIGYMYYKRIDYATIFIYNDRIIEVEFDDYCRNNYEKDCEKEINDLIQAGLVEKVENENN